MNARRGGASVPDRMSREHQTASLGSGAAGRAIFFTALYGATRAEDAARPRGAGSGWGGAHDVLNGTAGIGLALLYAAREFDEPAFLDAAIAAGDDLLASAQSICETGSKPERGR